MAFNPGPEGDNNTMRLRASCIKGEPYWPNRILSVADFGPLADGYTVGFP